MTGKEVLDQAMSLLGYTDSDGHLNSQTSRPVWQRALFVINQIYRDLWYVTSDKTFTPLSHIGESVHLPERAAGDAMPYGVAMLLAQGEGDNHNQSLFAELYNRKRAALTVTDTRQDVLPSIEG